MPDFSAMGYPEFPDNAWIVCLTEAEIDKLDSKPAGEPLKVRCEDLSGLTPDQRNLVIAYILADHNRDEDKREEIGAVLIRDHNLYAGGCEDEDGIFCWGVIHG